VPTPLITLEQAKWHLRVVSTNEDDDIYRKVEQASDLVLERCNSTSYWRGITTTWDSDTVPRSVQSAILVLLAHLYENRGQDMKAHAEVWAAVDSLIRMNKDPVIV
jgi:hypothetical protein